MSILQNFIYKQFLSKTITFFMYVVYMYVNIHFEFKYVCTWGYNDNNANPYFIFWVYALLYYSRNKNHAKFNSTCTCLSDGKFSIHINKYSWFAVFRSSVFQVNSKLHVIVNVVFRSTFRYFQMKQMGSVCYIDINGWYINSENKKKY